jgi:hypothetical protein
VARPALVEWYNPISQKKEWVNGVDCACYECRWESQFHHPRAKGGGFYDGIPYTKAEYRVHQRERASAYNKYLEIKQENKIRRQELKSAHTKETEAPGEHGRSPGVTTRFNLSSGQLSSDDDRLLGNVRWETLWRASIE